MKGVRGGAPIRTISFVSLVAYGPKVFLLSLSHEGLQFLKPGRVVPNKFSLDFFLYKKIFLREVVICLVHLKSFFDQNWLS